MNRIFGSAIKRSVGIRVPPYCNPSSMKYLSTTSQDLSADAVRKAAEKDQQLRQSHQEFKQKFNANEAVDTISVHKKKLIYRSKQRGLREVDILLGTWAENNVPNMNDEELEMFEKIVNLETLEIFNALSKPVNTLPEDIKSPVLEKLRDYTASNITNFTA